MNVIHSSASQLQSQWLVVCSIQTLKNILEKNGQNLSQLLLNKSIYSVNCKEDGEKGSAISRFMEIATRTSIPNSWLRQIGLQKQLELLSEEIEKHVNKKERTVGKYKDSKMGH